MHKIPACSTLLRHCRSPAVSARSFQATQSSARLARCLSTKPESDTPPSTSQLSVETVHRTKMSLSAGESLKLSLILKCAEQLKTLNGLCSERKARYTVSGNKRKVHIRSREVADLTVVENVFRKMLNGIDSHVFEISHAARSVLKLNNVGKFRSLCDSNLEGLDVQLIRRNPLTDGYVYTAHGSPEALVSFKRNLDDKLNSVRHIVQPLPKFVPSDASLQELCRKINSYPNTICFIDRRAVKCWTSGAETQTQVETDLKAFIDGWKDPSEYRWVGSHVMAKYIQNYLNSNKHKSSLFHKLEILNTYDQYVATLKLIGLKYPVARLSAEIERIARDTAHIDIHLPDSVVDSPAGSQFRDYWAEYNKEMFVILPTVSNPRLTLCGPFDCLNHRLLYFYRALRNTSPETFHLLQPTLSYKYNAFSQYMYDANEKGIIGKLKAKFPEATFSTVQPNHLPSEADSERSVQVDVSGSLEDLIQIDSVLKECIPIVLGPSYPNSDKIVRILQENDIISTKVVADSYAAGHSTMLKSSEPQLAREAREHIIRMMGDYGHRYRYFLFSDAANSSVKHYASNSLIKELKEFAHSIDMPITILTSDEGRDIPYMIRVEGVGDFTQYLKMRNFIHHIQTDQENKAFRQIYLNSSEKVSSQLKRQWMLKHYENVLNELDGPLFLCEDRGKFYIECEEEQLEEAKSLLQTAVNELSHRIFTGPIDIELNELESEWPLVLLWTSSDSEDTPSLEMVGNENSVNDIMTELSASGALNNSSASRAEVPLRHKGFPFLNHLGKKLFPPDGTHPKSWPSLFPEGKCSMHVLRSPHWNIVLRGDTAEVEKAHGRLLEIMEGISYREVFLDNTIFGGGTLKKEIEMKQSKMGQLKQQLMSLEVLDRVIDDTEVSVAVGAAKERLILSVVGDDAEGVELAAQQLKNFCEELQVEEIQLPEKTLRYKYIHDLMKPQLELFNEKSPNVQYFISHEYKVITVLGTPDHVKRCAESIRDILSDTADIKLDVSDEFLVQFLDDSLRKRHGYLKNLFPNVFLSYHSEEKTLDIFGPSSEVTLLQKYLADITHETYTVDSGRFKKYATLRQRLKHLPTGVPIMGGKDLDVHLVGEKKNIRCVVDMLDFVMEKKRDFHLTLSSDGRHVPLDVATGLVTKAVEDKFPNVKWWLLGNELHFSGSESEASEALRFVVDKYS